MEANLIPMIIADTWSNGKMAAITATTVGTATCVADALGTTA